MHDPVAYSRAQLDIDIESAWLASQPWVAHGDQQAWLDAPGQGTTTHTNCRLDLLPEWRPLIQQIEHHARLAWPQLAPPEYRDHEPDLAVTELWINYGDPGAPGPAKHVHLNPLAAVYYPEGHDSMGLLHLDLLDHVETVSIAPAGTLILFPGTIDHWAGPNHSQQRRRVVAGNLTLRGVSNQKFVDLARAQGYCQTSPTSWQKYNGG